jgi:hypothetical protein
MFKGGPGLRAGIYQIGKGNIGCRQRWEQEMGGIPPKMADLV